MPTGNFDFEDFVKNCNIEGLKTKALKYLTRNTNNGVFFPGINKETLSIKHILSRDINEKLREYLKHIDPQYINNKNFYEITFTNSFTNEKQVDQLVFNDKLESVTVKDGVLYYTFKQKETDEVKIL